MPCNDSNQFPKGWQLSPLRSLCDQIEQFLNFIIQEYGRERGLAWPPRRISRSIADLSSKANSF